MSLPPIATIVSKPFKLAEWKKYSIPSQVDLTWHRPIDPVASTDEDRQKVRGKWVYVYRRKGISPPAPGDTPDTNLIPTPQIGALLFLEMFIDDQGGMHAIDPNQDPRWNADAKKRPAPDQMTFLSNLTFEHTINGVRVFYYFFVCRIRVDQRILLTPSHLETKTTELLPEVDLASPGDFVRLDDGDYVIGLDPLTVALNLHKLYVSSRDRYLTYTVPSPDNPERDQCVARHEKKLLGDMLVKLMDHSLEMQSKLGAKFATGKEKEMRDSLKDYDAVVNGRIQKYSLHALRLVFWLLGRLTLAVELAHKVHEDVDFADFLEIWDQCTERIEESDPGRVFLTKAIQNKNHFVHEYVLMQQSPPLCGSPISTGRSSRFLTSGRNWVPWVWQSPIFPNS